MIGVECENNGTTEPWTARMVDVMVRISAACADVYGFPASMVCGHKEWAPARKIDPHTLDMTDIRARVLGRMHREPDQTEDDMVELIELAYREAGQRVSDHERAISEWAFAILTKPSTRERLNGVNYVRSQLGLEPIPV